MMPTARETSDVVFQLSRLIGCLADIFTSGQLSVYQLTNFRVTLCAVAVAFRGGPCAGGCDADAGSKLCDLCVL